jgi:hypothetical protein
MNSARAAASISERTSPEDLRERLLVGELMPLCLAQMPLDQQPLFS